MGILPLKMLQLARHLSCMAYIPLNQVPVAETEVLATNKLNFGTTSAEVAKKLFSQIQSQVEMDIELA